MISSIEGTILANIRLDVIKGIFARLLSDWFLISKSFHSRAEELEGKRLLFWWKRWCIVVILSRSWLFGLEWLPSSFLNSRIHIRFVYEGIEVGPYSGWSEMTCTEICFLVWTRRMIICFVLSRPQSDSSFHDKPFRFVLTPDRTSWINM